MATEKTKFFSTKNITVMASLTAISWVLYMFVKFPLPFIFPAFLDIQFSDMPALIGGYMLGPVSGCLIIVVKCLLKMPFSSTACVGELADIIVGIAFVLPSSLIYKRYRTKKGAGISLIIGAVTAVCASLLANAFILIPFYSVAIPGGWDTILNMMRSLFGNISRQNFFWFYLPLSVLPFNILRCAVCAVITFFAYKGLGRAVDKLFAPHNKPKVSLSAAEPHSAAIDPTVRAQTAATLHESDEENTDKTTVDPK